MQSDLTFIPFTHWNDGLTQLLKNLQTAGAPKAESPTSVAALLQTKKCVSNAPETLWSNLIPIKKLPARLYRYEHELAMAPSSALQAVSQWPHFRENATVCWSFQTPPAELIAQYRFVRRGTCDAWRTASGPDLNFYNLGKKVINSTLFHRLVASGLRYDADNRYMYVPDETPYRRLTFTAPNGKSWIKPVGLRSFWTTKGRESVRYHLSPHLRAWLDFAGGDFVSVRTRLYLTQLDGTPIKPSLMHSRRKAICKSWWNHEWLSRVLATLQLIASSDEEIRIGSEPDEQLVLSRFPMSLASDHTLLEPLLKSREESKEFTDLAERKYDDLSEVLINEETTGEADAANA